MIYGYRYSSTKEDVVIFQTSESSGISFTISPAAFYDSLGIGVKSKPLIVGLNDYGQDTVTFEFLNGVQYSAYISPSILYDCLINGVKYDFDFFKHEPIGLVSNSFNFTHRYAKWDTYLTRKDYYLI